MGYACSSWAVITTSVIVAEIVYLVLRMSQERHFYKDLVDCGVS
jgi:hypothetical protein